MEIHQQAVAGEVIVSGVNAKMRISNGGTRHVDNINNLLKIRGRTIGVDVVNGEN